MYGLRTLRLNFNDPAILRVKNGKYLHEEVVKMRDKIAAKLYHHHFQQKKRPPFDVV